MYIYCIMGYTTKKSLLEAIQRGDEISWAEFYATYRNLILLRGRDYHLTDTELEDLCQTVVIDFFKMGKKFKYDPAKGRFRDYLRRVISHNALDIIRKRRKTEPLTENIDLPDPDSRSRNWDTEWHLHILTQALAVLRTQIELVTYQAFELYALKNRSAEDVAKFLGININMVYVAKSRAMQKLKPIIQKLKEEV
ncbi:MAG: sigma-70 family RNA polymerase sigma factor [Lentisphaeria bacterium]|nr:sigma-70 family RNA polymerase sigma factor [Lentisphaeria bacterium]